MQAVQLSAEDGDTWILGGGGAATLLLLTFDHVSLQVQHSSQKFQTVDWMHWNWHRIGTFSLCCYHVLVESFGCFYSQSLEIIGLCLCACAKHPSSLLHLPKSASPACTTWSQTCEWIQIQGSIVQRLEEI